MKVAVIAIACTAMLAGCATTETVWVKDGAPAHAFQADRGQCIAQTEAAVSGNPWITAPAMSQAGAALNRQRLAIFSGCMQGKGWRLEDRPIR